MNRLLSTLIFIIISQAVLSQNKNNLTNWRLTVVDSVGLKGVDRATVSLDNYSSFVTDAKGVVNIDKKLINEESIVTISYIGYKTMSITVHEKFPDSVRLTASITNLKEVKINAATKKIVLGNINESFDGGYLPTNNEEMAEYIPNNERIAGTLISVTFALKDDNKGIGKPFKVNLYAKNKYNMYPGEELLKDSIIAYNPQGLPIVTVDISKYNIQIPDDGIFIGFETLSPSWYGKELIKRHGISNLRIPGIKGRFKNHNFHFDDTPRNGVSYSLMRYIGALDSWSIFDDGTDFAIGVTVSAD